MKITDRITRAVELIEKGKIYKQDNNTFRVFTERQNVPYTVTLTSCDCEDRAEICKHRWAAIGATAALLISEIRQAGSLSALQSIGQQYSDAMKSLPDAFVIIARKEYRAKQCELTSCGNVSSQILIKPQPKSNGHYNGIEI